MRERPILFSGPMVRAILREKNPKRVTRRLVKGAPEDATALRLDNGFLESYVGDLLPDQPWQPVIGPHGCESVVRCPYGDPGDRLWVRETWAQNWNQTSDVDMDRSLVYRADGETRAVDNGLELPWRPSIHMPRWASRLTLEVVSVRVERLQDITAEGAIREGLSTNSWKYGIPDLDGLPGTDNTGWAWVDWCVDPRKAFARLWDQINGERAPWSSNPWVWRIEFNPVEVLHA